jgi:hypothetical protein
MKKYESDTYTRLCLYENYYTEQDAVVNGNGCYHPVQKLLSFRLLSGNFKIRINTTVILPVILYGRETRSLILREEHRLRLFEDREQKRIFVRKGTQVTVGWETA